MRFPRGWQAADETTVLDPDVSFADTLPPPDETAVLSRADLADKLDQERMARADAEEQVRLRDQEIKELKAALAEWKQAAGAEASLVDDLGVRSLPSLAGYLTEPFDEPIPEDAIQVGASLVGTWLPVAGDTAEPLPEPLHGTWTPPPPTDWDARYAEAVAAIRESVGEDALWAGSVGD